MSEASGHRGLWTEAKYPGDTVRVQAMHRDGVLGDIRIQKYGIAVRVGSFLPGVIECPPGDTPKVWPEKSVDFRSDNQSDLADACFDRYVQEAYAGGWQNYHPNNGAEIYGTNS